MIATWSVGHADANMPEEILVDLGNVIAAHPWWSARADLTLAFLRTVGVQPPADVLDVGCGWGVTLTALERCGYRVAGLDISRRSLEQLDRRDRELFEADLTQPLPERHRSFEAVLALDVLEHLDDDNAALTRMFQLTRPGGWAIVSVPALPRLFSEFDAVQGHRRRYEPATLSAAFRNSGFEVKKVIWWGSWLVPLMRKQRAQSLASPDSLPSEIYRRYLRLPPWPVSLVLKAAFRLDHFRTLRDKGRTGTSLFAIAQRPIQA